MHTSSSHGQGALRPPGHASRRDVWALWALWATRCTTSTATTWPRLSVTAHEQRRSADILHQQRVVGDGPLRADRDLVVGQALHGQRSRVIATHAHPSAAGEWLACTVASWPLVLTYLQSPALVNAQGGEFPSGGWVSIHVW